MQTEPLTSTQTKQLEQLAVSIKNWAEELGFQQCGITLPDVTDQTAAVNAYLEAGYQGEMSYLNNNQDKRLDPTKLRPGTKRIICVRMDYMPTNSEKLTILSQPNKAYISRYTLGRDYHKIMRKRLTKLGQRINAEIGNLGFRAFVDSAPVLEKALATKAGIGWVGKHGLILNRESGSWFLLGELFIDLPLPIDQPYTEEHCGTCTSCLDVCPTDAFVKPGVLNASRCISYLTIELKGSIPEQFRAKMGNRIFGCDDCQMICPWNYRSPNTEEDDFQPRHQLDNASLLDLFNWDEATFLKRTEGSAIRRTGYIGWLRNIAVALGNSEGGKSIEQALQNKAHHQSEIVREHASWALMQLASKVKTQPLQLLTHPRSGRIKD